MGQFNAPITIKAAVDKIRNNEYLLPAIQRKFTWTSEQVELLFDSIMRDYPINSFMSWEIKDKNLKNNLKFYEFIKEFREYFKEENPHLNTTNFKDFEAIIDGQQRLTSLYIGLLGSYAYKLPRKWSIDNEENIPTRYLFLNLSNEIKSEIDNTKKYDFRFLADHKESYIDKNGTFWFKVENILNFEDNFQLMKFLLDNKLNNNSFASRALSILWERVHKDKLINIYVCNDKDPDKVLDIFLRTNSGGTPLSFSDLLMSMSIANWKKIDARKELNSLVKEVNKIGNPSFKIEQDFILKTSLVLLSDDIKFQLKNFKTSLIEDIETYWKKIRQSILSAFQLFESLEFDNKNFRAKNAAIPIIYFIYYHNLQEKIKEKNFLKKINSLFKNDLF